MAAVQSLVNQMFLFLQFIREPVFAVGLHLVVHVLAQLQIELIATLT